jgi:hypothetical protein
MNRIGWLLFWASVVIVAVGVLDRFTPRPLVEGIAPGTYWKGGMAFVAWCVALAVLRPVRPTP